MCRVGGRDSLAAQLVKNPPAMQEVQFLGQVDPLEKGSLCYPLQCSWASLVAQMVKNLPTMWETWVQSLEDPLEEGTPLQYSWLENPHGQRSLVGYSPWGHKELDMSEQLSTK